MVDEFWMNFQTLYFIHSRDGIHMCYATKISYINRMKFHILKGWNTGDDFNPRWGYGFQPSNIWIFIKIFNHLLRMVFPTPKVWITGCVFQPKIGWKFHTIKGWIGHLFHVLKSVFTGNLLDTISYHNWLNFISLPNMHYTSFEIAPTCPHATSHMAHVQHSVKPCQTTSANPGNAIER